MRCAQYLKYKATSRVPQTKYTAASTFVPAVPIAKSAQEEKLLPDFNIPLSTRIKQAAAAPAISGAIHALWFTSKE